MCGICGLKIENDRLKLPINNIILGMNEQIMHRGPDHQGTYINLEKNLALGNTRLAIQDLGSSGNQPMISRSERFVIVLNGEIYNHLELRKELKEKFSFDNWLGSSDTETLSVLLDFFNIDEVLRRLNGMFAFAAWDKKEKKIFLVRDRTGEKPLYYYYDKESKIFAFSSELKSFIKFSKNIFNLKLNQNAIGLFLKFKNVPSPHSIFEKINKLEPASILTFSENNFIYSLKKYWELKSYIKNNIISADYNEVRNLLKIKIENAVKRQLISDKPIGCFLSGGIDSSLIASVMQSISKNNITTFSIGFDNPSSNEAILAKKIANHISSDHFEYYFKEEDALNIIPNLPRIYDEPFSDSSQLPTYLLCSAAKKKMTVALSGDGGDELFGGYNRYLFFKKYWPIINKIPLSIREVIFHILNTLPINILSFFEKIVFLKTKNPVELVSAFYKFLGVLRSAKIIDAYDYLISDWQDSDNFYKKNTIKLNILNNFNTESDFENIMLNDFSNYLPNDIMTKVDRAAMNVSLETRMPFMDVELVEFATSIKTDFKIKGNDTKHILKDILTDYLPKSFFLRPKKGFSVPIDSWLRGPLKDWTYDHLKSKFIRNGDYFNINVLDKTVDEHFRNKKNHGQKIWSVVILAQWIDFYKV